MSNIFNKVTLVIYWKKKDNLQSTTTVCAKTIHINIIIIIVIFIFKAQYIRKNFRSEMHKIHCNTYIFKIFIISLNLHVKTKC